MANITVSADVHALLNSAGNLTNSTAALGTLGAPVTATSITAKLGGTVPVANKIGNEYLKDTLEPNYITLTNQQGYVIPSNSLGQKNGTLYFGNTPVFNPISKFRKEAATNTAQTLGTFFIPASAMVNEGKFWIDLDANYQVSNGGGDPGEVAVCVDFLTGALNNLTTGVVLMLPGNTRGRLRIQGPIVLFEVDPNILIMDSSQVDAIGIEISKTIIGAGFNAPTVKYQTAAVFNFEATAAANANATVVVRLISYQGAHANTAVGLISGSCLIESF